MFSQDYNYKNKIIMPGTIGRFEITKTLGSGASCKVKLGFDTETGRKVAVKILNDGLDDKTKELVMTEVEAMGHLKNQHIIEQYEYGVGTYVKKNGKVKEVQYIVLELALGGELFDFVAISGKFPEPLARYYFKEFMDGLSYCHSHGIAHRDLKPENLLLDSSYTLKIADFGFAAPIEGRDGSGKLKTKLGTMNYMAPEIHLLHPYEGSQVDIFAAAIILFIMVAQHPPFTTAQPSDPFYRCLAGKRGDIFWRTHCKSKPNGDKFFSEEFKDFIEQMLKLEPKQRPTMQEVYNHPWMQGPVPTKDKVVAEFKKRDATVKAQMEADKQEKDAEKAKRVDQAKKKAAMRSGPTGDFEESKTEEILHKPSKNIEEYERLFAANTEFFSTYGPDMIEQALLEELSKQGIKPKTKTDQYKVKFTMVSKDQSGMTTDVDICVRILKVNEQQVCVEFLKLAGDQFRFLEHFLEFKNQSLAFLNDSIAVSVAE